MPLQSPGVTSALQSTGNMTQILGWLQIRANTFSYYLFCSPIFPMCLFGKVLRPNTANSPLLNYLRAVVSSAKAGLPLKGANSASPFCSQMRTPKFSTLVIQIMDFIPLKPIPQENTWFLAERPRCVWLLGGTVLSWGGGGQEQREGWSRTGISDQLPTSGCHTLSCFLS